jgi:ribulose-bisphosphate carboxylase large chain
LGAITAVYHAACGTGEAQALARSIAVEQTVEVPESLIDARIDREIVGRVVAVDPLPDGRFALRLDFNPELVNGLPALLSLVYGNVSMMQGVRLAELHLPPGVLARFRGPSHGIEGIRELLGVHGRPLLATVLKPRGSPDDRFRAIAEEFALAGGDVVKDDNNLIDESFATFQRRVALCQEAVTRANERTGRHCLYLANICVPLGRLERYVDGALRLGVRGVLIPPLLMGLDVVRDLADRRGLVVMGHPSFTGAFFEDRRHGIDPGVLLGTIYRLAGIDIAIFVNHGGRFRYRPEECLRVAAAARAPLGAIRPAFPAPAGGMGFERLDDMVREYGPDTMLVVGGALLGGGKGVGPTTEAYLARLKALHPERLEPPRRDAAPPRAPVPGGIVRHFRGDFTWEGRAAKEYRKGDDLPYRDVLRHELLGEAGEATAFSLRYFEIAAGGFSSAEKHVHTHAIIAVRGKGVLTVDGKRFELKPNDVAYVPPLTVHQLRNEGEGPFGFYCIVDRDRDRPSAP